MGGIVSDWGRLELRLVKYPGTYSRRAEEIGEMCMKISEAHTAYTQATNLLAARREVSSDRTVSRPRQDASAVKPLSDSNWPMLTFD